MKGTRRIAWIAFVVALLAIIAIGFFRATRHEESRPETTPASSASAPSAGPAAQ